MPEDGSSANSRQAQLRKGNDRRCRISRRAMRYLLGAKHLISETSVRGGGEPTGRSFHGEGLSGWESIPAPAGKGIGELNGWRRWLYVWAVGLLPRRAGDSAAGLGDVRPGAGMCPAPGPPGGAINLATRARGITKYQSEVETAG